MKDKNDLDGLVKALQHKDRDIAINAAIALGDIGDKRTLAPLLQFYDNSLSNDDLYKAIVKFSDVDALIHIWNGPYYNEEAAKELGELGDSKAVEPLLKGLTDKYYDKRMAVVIALGKIGDKKAIKPIINSLSYTLDYDNLTLSFRIVAIEQLINFGTPAVDPLIEALNDPYIPQDMIITALRRINNKKALNPLLKYYKSGKSENPKELIETLKSLGWEPEVSDEIKYYIAKKDVKALIKIGEPTVKPLIKILNNKKVKKEEKIIAAKVLGALNNEKGLDILITNLSDSSEYYRKEAKDLLNIMGNKKAIDPIINYLFTYTAMRPNEPPELLEIFGDYSSIIAELFTIKQMTKRGTWSNKDFTYSYDCSISDNALNKLCELKTPISNNLLNKVKNERRNIKVKISQDCHGEGYNDLSFLYQREKAQRELEKRGNPVYDPLVYEEESLWQI